MFHELQVADLPYGVNDHPSQKRKNERAHDFARTGVALIVDLDLVEGWFGLTPDGPIGRVRMLRGTTQR